MNIRPASLRFWIENQVEETIEVHGLATVQDDRIILEFIDTNDQGDDAYYGELKEINIPITAIASIQIQRDWVQRILKLQLQSIQEFAPLRIKSIGELKMKLSYRDCAVAEQWILFLRLKLQHGVN
jgi:hypothetical protein